MWWRMKYLKIPELWSLSSNGSRDHKINKIYSIKIVINVKLKKNKGRAGEKKRWVMGGSGEAILGRLSGKT